MTEAPCARAWSTRRPRNDPTVTFDRSLTASSSRRTRSSTLNNGVLEGFSTTPTITESNSCAARPTTSRCPLVTGSNVPGHRAVKPIDPPGTGSGGCLRNEVASEWPSVPEPWGANFCDLGSGPPSTPRGQAIPRRDRPDTRSVVARRARTAGPRTRARTAARPRAVAAGRRPQERSARSLARPGGPGGGWNGRHRSHPGSHPRRCRTQRRTNGSLSLPRGPTTRSRPRSAGDGSPIRSGLEEPFDRSFEPSPELLQQGGVRDELRVVLQLRERARPSAFDQIQVLGQPGELEVGHAGLLRIEQRSLPAQPEIFIGEHEPVRGPHHRV